MIQWMALVWQDGCTRPRPSHPMAVPCQRAFVLALSLGIHHITGCGSHAFAAGVLDAGLASPARLACLVDIKRVMFAVYYIVQK